MKKYVFKTFFGKAVMSILAVVFVMAAVCLFNGEGSVAYAAENYFVVEPKNNVDFTDKTAPEPTTEGKENYIFAGYYEEETCETPVKEATDKTVYAKFVPSEVLSVKAQLKSDTTDESASTNLRLVSSVDSLNYKTVGFEIYYNGATTPIIVKSSTVYERIVASESSGVDYNYGSKVVDAASKYFVTATLINIKKDNFGNSFYIKPYWKTMDGTTVYGQGKFLTVNNGLDESNINTAVFVGEGYNKDATPTVTVAGTEYTATVAHYEKPYVYLNVDLGNKKVTELNSLSVVTVTDGTKNGTTTYRNLLTTYNGTADTSWCTDAPEGTTEYIIATSADLYGLAKLINDNIREDYFYDTTIYLAADITINEGTAFLDNDGTAGFTLSDSEDELQEWSPIGRDATNQTKRRFRGTFDGNEHTISGIYCIDNVTGNTNGTYWGLFGITHADSTLTNFSLTNSVFISKSGCGNNGSALIGSIAGQAMGDVTNIYSNAIVVSESDIQLGGFAGRLNPDGANNIQTINNCWFNGKVYATSSTQKKMAVGGIVGNILNVGTVNITNCLNTGSITCIYKATGSAMAGVAGLVGEMGNSKTLFLNMDNCLNSGVITVQTKVTGEGDTVTTTDYTKGVAGFLYNANYGSENKGIYKNSEGKEVVAGGTVNVIVKNSISTYSSHKNAYQRAQTNSNTDYDGDGVNDTKYAMGTFTNCISAGTSNTDAKFSGVDAKTNAARLGIYTNDEKDPTKYWVVKESGLIGLKSFTDNWIDFGWYDNHKTEEADTFVIETAEEFYAFSNVSQTDSFAGDTVKLAADIKLNIGTASVWSTTEDTNILNSLRKFKPISPESSEATAFAGTFDGNNRTISGLYISSTTAGAALFGKVTGTVKNFSLKNSYIYNTAATTGSIVGLATGATIENIYSDAYVTTNGKVHNAGGIVAYANGAGTTTTITGCWFAGEVKQMQTAQYCGGILARQGLGTAKITDCLFTGKVTTNRDTANAYTGGIVGGVYSTTAGEASATKVYITNTFSNGKVYADNSKTTAAVGGILGSANSGSGATASSVVMDVYMENVYDATEVTSVSTLSMQVDGVGLPSNRTVHGIPRHIEAGDLNGTAGYQYTNLLVKGSKEDKQGKGLWVATVNGPELYRFSDKQNVEGLANVARAELDWYYNGFTYVNNVLQDRDYVISSANDFRGFAYIVNNTEDKFFGKTVTVDENTDVIDLSEGWTVTVNDDGTVTQSGTPNVWIPIGNNATSSDRFYGTFDGNGCTIKGVYVVNDSKDFRGLFGYGGSKTVDGTRYTAEIKNFTIENSYFNVHGQGGAVVGALQATVRNVHVTDTVAITATNTNVGGIAGRLFVTLSGTGIYNCWFDGTVVSSKAAVGGIVGTVGEGTASNPKKIENCLFTGTIMNSVTSNPQMGGIVGLVYGYDSTKYAGVTIKNCISAGTVKTAMTEDEDSVGAVLGSVVRRTATYTSTAVIENVYYTAEPVNTTTGESISVTSVAPGCGKKGTDSDNGTLKGAAQHVPFDNLKGTSAYAYTELSLASQQDNVDADWVLKTNGVPELNLFSDSDVASIGNVQKITKGWYYNKFTYNANAGQATTTFTINNDGDMYGFADFVNSGKKTFKGNTIKLGKDIVFNGVTTGTEAAGWADGSLTAPTTSWVPIGTVNGDTIVTAFQGTFDGDGHTIKGLYVSSDEIYLGLFRKIQDATICDLRLENSYIVNTLAAGATNTTMASIAGGGDGTLENIYSNAIIKGQRIVGGIIGRVSQTKTADTSLTVKSCWFDGIIDIDYKGSSRVYVGGVVGYAVHGATVMDTCLYTGTIDFDIDYTGTSTNFGPQVGGLCSGDNGTSTAWVQITNCMSAGELHTTVLDCEKDPTVTYIGSVCGDLRHADSFIKNTYALTTMTDTRVGKNETKARTSITSKSVDTTKENIVVEANTAYMGKEEALYGESAQLLTTLPFKAEDRVDAPIWAAIAGHLPVPATLAGDRALTITVGKIDTVLAGTGTEADPWKISTVEELFGFAQLSKSKTFKNEYVVLTNNIVLNPGQDAASWESGEVEPILPWNTSIGAEKSSKASTDGHRFEGTFDGQGYEISGLCFKNASDGTQEYVGLFATTECGSTVKNLRLVNSYIEQTGTGWTGAVIGDCRGTVSNVYSDAIVKTYANIGGGIVGRANGYDYTHEADGTETRTSQTISNCWFDGDIILKGTAVNGGGIIGNLIQGEWTLTNCVFSGTITSEYSGTSNANVGGICGSVNAPGTTSTSEKESTLRLNSCISAGTIQTVNADKGAGAVVGRLGSNVNFYEVKENDVTTKTFRNLEATNLIMNNVFATREAGYNEVGTLESKTEKDTAGNSYTASPVSTGSAVWTNNADRLVGYCTEEVKDGYYVGGKLDFENDFVIREEGVPVPKVFADLSNVTVIATSDLNTILALKTMDSTWSTEKAVNYGLGHYVLTTTGKTYANYTAYLAALEAQGFTAYTTLEETGTDGVYNVIYTREAGEWVLNVLFVQNTGKVTLTISNGFDSLSPDLEPETNITSGDVTVSMLQLEGSKSDFSTLEETIGGYQDYYYGNSFVFKLPNGHFIISDGGNKGDMTGLMAYLRKEAGLSADDTTSKIYIDAWTVTHQHNDHFGVMNGIVDNPDYAKQLVVNALYINEPNQKAMLCYAEETNVMSAVKKQYRGIRMLKDANGNTPKVYWCQTGQTYYFDGLTMTILQSQEQIPVNSYGKRNVGGAQGTDYNTSTANMLFTTANGKKVYISGDSNYVNMEWMMSAYGESSQMFAEINVYQVVHHGKNTSYNISTKDNRFSDYIASKTASGKIDVTLFPCSVYYEYNGRHEVYNVFPAAGNANKHLIESLSSQYFNYGAGTIKVTLGETITAGLDTSVDTGTEDTEIEEGETGEQ